MGSVCGRSECVKCLKSSVNSWISESTFGPVGLEMLKGQLMFLSVC